MGQVSGVKTVNLPDVNYTTIVPVKWLYNHEEYCDQHCDDQLSPCYVVDGVSLLNGVGNCGGRELLFFQVGLFVIYVG